MQNQEVEAISTEFTRLANAEIAEHSQRYFRTGPGEYGHGDVFLGLRVPMIRELAKKYKEISEKTILHFLRSKFHEHRLFALIVLTLQYKKGSEEKREAIYTLYCKNRKYVNNWDLVDTSAPLIVGAHLIQRDRSVLLEGPSRNRFGIVGFRFSRLWPLFVKETLAIPWPLPRCC